jgi:hypothetical protein
MAISSRSVYRAKDCAGPKRVPLAAVRGSLIDPGPSPEWACELGLLRDALAKVLDRFRGERYQVLAFQVLALTYGTPGRDRLNPAGYVYNSEEIARVLQVPSGRVHAARYHALDRLRKAPDSRRLLLPFCDALAEWIATR